MPGPKISVKQIPCDVRLDKGKEEEVEMQSSSSSSSGIPMTLKARQEDVPFATEDPLMTLDDNKDECDSYGIKSVTPPPPNSAVSSIMQSRQQMSAPQQQQQEEAAEERPVSKQVEKPSESELVRVAFMSGILGAAAGIFLYKYFFSPKPPCEICPVEALPSV